jgi:hypothetical protein
MAAAEVQLLELLQRLQVDAKALAADAANGWQLQLPQSQALRLPGQCC